MYLDRGNTEHKDFKHSVLVQYLLNHSKPGSKPLCVVSLNSTVPQISDGISSCSVLKPAQVAVVILCHRELCRNSSLHSCTMVAFSSVSKVLIKSSEIHVRVGKIVAHYHCVAILCDGYWLVWYTWLSTCE